MSTISNQNTTHDNGRSVPSISTKGLLRSAGMLACLGGNVAHDINQGARQSGKAAFRAFLVHMVHCYSERLSDIVIMVNDASTRGADPFIL